ncbi:MAG TPA: hypothetical protein VG936_02495 [Lacunisphaera sp.]|nr:hypothetical protein [Lacunisphaera sp.]
MKTRIPALLALLALFLTSCAFIPRLGTSERSWRNHTISYELIYIQGNVKAYRSDGAYYYFNAGKLVMVNQTLVPAENVPAYTGKGAATKSGT